MSSASGGSRSGVDPGPDPVRGAARDPAQHQGASKYIASSGPALGFDAEGHPARPRHDEFCTTIGRFADEIYRVPILIVMATTNRGYILDMVPGQSFIEFLLKRGLRRPTCWTGPRPGPEEKSLRMEDYVIDFIPDCVRRVQQDSGETDVTVIGYCFGGVLSLLYGSIFNDGADEEPDLLHHSGRLPRDEAVPEFSDRRYFDVDRLVDSVRQRSRPR